MAIPPLPGVSNSSKLGAKPGTVQTALQNTGNTGANVNPNMPVMPQLAKQGKSDLQKGLSGVQPAQPKASPTKIVSQGLPMDPSKGYNIFAGQDAQQISALNQSMGLSNMTSLPALGAAGVSPAQMHRKFGSPEQWGDPQSMQFYVYQDNEVDGPSPFGDGPPSEDWGGMGQGEDFHGGDFGYMNTINETVAEALAGRKTSADWLAEWEEAGEMSPYPTQEPGQSDEDYQLEVSAWEDAAEQWVQKTYDETLSDYPEPPWDTPTPLEAILEGQGVIAKDAPGIDPVKKQEMFDQLDQEAAYKLDGVLAGMDRQAAMMGTFGSGAHMQAANGAIAQVLSDMAGKYNQINMLDAQLTETDHQQEFDNWQTLGQNIAGDLQDKMNMGQKIDEMLIQPYAEFIETKVDNPNQQQLMSQILTQISTNMYAEIYNQTGSVEQALTQTADLINQFFLSMGYDTSEIGLSTDLEPAGSVQLNPDYEEEVY